MKFSIYLLLGISFLFLNACKVGQRIVYVDDMKADTNYIITDVKPLLIQKNDRLSIFVSAKNPELAAPFNENVEAFDVGANGEVVTREVRNPLKNGYLVDLNGDIEFPILGTISVEGKSVNDVKNLLREKLISAKYINDPIVKVELTNLKINVIGEVKNIGVLDVPDNRINLLEAISRAGGLTTNASAQHVVVIREDNGTRKKTIVDLTSQDVFTSPVYQLQQNDIVFVEPKDNVPTPKDDMNWRLLTIGMSVVTVVFTALNFLK